MNLRQMQDAVNRAIAQVQDSDVDPEKVRIVSISFSNRIEKSGISLDINNQAEFFFSPYGS